LPPPEDPLAKAKPLGMLLLEEADLEARIGQLIRAKELAQVLEEADISTSSSSSSRVTEPPQSQSPGATAGFTQGVSVNVSLGATAVFTALDKKLCQMAADPPLYWKRRR